MPLMSNPSPSTQSNKSSVFATVLSIKRDLAILRTENNQEIVWPLSKLPKDITEGSELNLHATTSSILQQEKLDNNKAKKLLEMILNE